MVFVVLIFLSSANMAIIAVTHKPASIILLSVMYVYGINSRRFVLIVPADICMSLIAIL